MRTLTSKDSISHDLRGCGQYDLALDVARDVITALALRTGPENLDSLNAQKSFAVALRKAGHYEDALQEGKTAVRRYTEFLGEEHRYTLRAHINRINDLRVTDQLREAEELGRAALALCPKLDTPKGDITWATRVNLAVVLRRNAPEEARGLDEAAVQGMTAPQCGAPPMSSDVHGRRSVPSGELPRGRGRAATGAAAAPRFRRSVGPRP